MASPSPAPDMGPSASMPSNPGPAAATTPQAPQFALLDFFFPGFSMFATAVHKYAHIDLNLYIPLFMFLGILTVAWNYSSLYFWEQVETYFMSSVDIRTDDEIYNILMAWVANQRFAQGARQFVVNTNLNSRSWYLWRWDYDDDEEDVDSLGQQSEETKKKALSYTPSFGTHYFWYRGRLLLFKRNTKEQNGFLAVSEREEISICCFGRNPWILKELLHEARAQYMEKDQKKTLIYRGTTRSGSTEPTWQRCMARASRPFSTVILNEKVKNDLIEDVTDYLNPATQRWYSNRGIPYRRGYLLHGPPGTGKSSLSLALAGFFKMRIYIVSLSSISASEENLATLFAELPRRCVVLLEDIDTAGLTHTRAEDSKDSAAPAATVEPLEPTQLTPGIGVNKVEPSGRLSLSGLLNILDGVASQEGRVLIMTTNHVEKLDKALIRPGRVDMIVEFGRADRSMIVAIFQAIYAHLESDDGVQALPDPTLDPAILKARAEEKAKKQKEEDDRVTALANTFADKIPSHEFSPAELQGHLLRHKRNPQAAIDNAEEFIEKSRADKKEKELKEAEDKRKAEKEKEEAEAKKKKEEEEEKAKKQKEEEEEKAKAAKKEKKEAKKKAKKEAKKAERRRKRKEVKLSSSGSDSDSDSDSDSSSDEKSKPETKDKKELPKIKTTVENSSEKQATLNTEKKDSGYATPVSASVEAAAQKQELPEITTTVPTPAAAEKEESTKFVKHEKKDSGYGTPVETESL